MKWYNSSCQVISYFNSYNLTGRHVGPQPAWLLQHCAGWTTCQLDPASSVDSKHCSTANFCYPLFWTYNGRARSSVFSGFTFQSASSSKSLYSPSEQWMTVLQCTCRPTSPESLTCHLDWDSGHPQPTNWLFHLTTSLLSAGGTF